MRRRFYGDRALSEPPIIPVTPLDIQDFIVLHNFAASPKKMMSFLLASPARSISPERHDQGDARPIAPFLRHSSGS